MPAHVEALFPLPLERPDRRRPRARDLYENRVRKVESIRENVCLLGAEGLGTDLERGAGKPLGTLNAMLE